MHYAAHHTPQTDGTPQTSETPPEQAFGIGTLNSRIALLAILLFVVTGSILWLLFQENERINQIEREFNETLLPYQQALSRIREGVLQVEISIQYWQANPSDQHFQQIEAAWASRLMAPLSAMRQLATESPLERHKTVANQVGQHVEKWEAARKTYVDLMAKKDLMAEERHQFRVISAEKTLRKEQETLLTLLNLSAATETKQLKAALEELSADSDRYVFFMVLLGIFSLSAAVLVTMLVISRLRQAISRNAELMLRLSKGDVKVETELANDEMDTLAISGERLKNNLQQASQFARAIGEGQLDAPFTPAGPEDILGNALLQMRDKLASLAAEEHRRQWMSEGIARFSEIIRQNTEHFGSLADSLVKGLTKYLNANQGGLFMLTSKEDKTALELIACYAYDKKKYVQKYFEVGEKFAEGIIGQAYLEKESILLDEVPQDHVAITSGLGMATPKSVLIVPMKVNGKVEGVLEFASFNAFEPHQVELIERLGEAIASAIVSTRDNERMMKLVDESQVKTNLLHNQEAIMLQGLEQLAQAQEEMMFKNRQLEKMLEDSRQNEEALKNQRTRSERITNILQSVVDGYPAIVYLRAPDGRFMLVNQYFADLLEVNRTDLVNKKAEACLPAELAEYFNRQDRLLNASLVQFHQEERIPFPNQPDKLFSAFRYLIRDQATGQFSTCCIATDVTEQRSLDRQLVTLQKNLHDLEELIPGVLFEFRASKARPGEYAYFSKHAHQVFSVAPEVLAEMVRPELNLFLTTNPSSERFRHERLLPSLFPGGEEVAVVIEAIPFLKTEDGVVWKGIILPAALSETLVALRKEQPVSIDTTEVLRQLENMRNLQASLLERQSELDDMKKQLADARKIETERANEQIEANRQLFIRQLERFRTREQDLMKEISELRKVLTTNKGGQN